MSFTESLETIIRQNANGLLSAHPTWSRVPLGDVFDVQNGFPFESKYFNSSGQGMPLLRIRDVVRGSTGTHYSGTFDHSFVVNPGDIVIGMDGDFQCRAWRGAPALLNQRVCRLRSRDDHYPATLLTNVLQGYLDAINAKTSAITVKHLSSKTIEDVPLPLPPRREQSRIGEAIDSCLTRLDDAVASLERVQDKLKSYRASVLKAAVEGRLVPTEASLAGAERRPYEPAEVLLAGILKERRLRWEEAELGKLKAARKTPKDEKWKAKYVAPVAPDTSTLPELPEGWCWITVDQLAGHGDNTLCDGPFGSNLKTEHYTDHGPRVVRLQNIGDGAFHDEEAHISDSHFARLRKHEVLPGDLLVASLGTELPRACLAPDWLGPAIVKADCLRFAVNPQLAEGLYVLHALNSAPTRKRLENLVHGVGRPRIGLGLFRTTAVPLPPRAEQARITALVEQLVSTSSVLQRNAALDIRRCARLRQAVLKWAFEGKLVDQDPTDEPAEQLLARIRAERAADAQSKKSSGGRRAKGAA